MESFGKWEMSDEEEAMIKIDLSEVWNSWSKELSKEDKKWT